MVNSQNDLLLVVSVISLTILFISFYLFLRKYYKIIPLPERVLMDDENMASVIIYLRKMMVLPFRNLSLDFSAVKEISHEGYMILLAQAEKALYRGKTIYLKNIPIERRNIMSIIGRKNKNHKTYHSYLKLTNKEHRLFLQSSSINPKITVAIEKELTKIGIRNYYEFNTLLTELFGNAIEHGIKQLNINWWMYHYKNNATKTITFVFVDMGIGVIDSYKKAGLSSEYKGKSDDCILLDALNGKLGSSTKQPNRGRGLPQIKRMVENKWISDFVLTTNSVSLRYIDDKFTLRKHADFVGTYYSWTINKENFLRWTQR